MELPFVTDYAKSNQSICRRCSKNIVKGTLRLAIMLQSRTFDDKVPNWYHFPCFFIEHMPETTKHIKDFNNLQWSDKKQIADIIAKGESPYASQEAQKNIERVIAIANSKASVVNYGIAYAKNGQTNCTNCSIKIEKSEIRISRKDKKNLWYHPKCFCNVRENAGFLECISKVNGFDTLSSEDQEIMKTLLPIKYLNNECGASPPKRARLSCDEVDKKISENEQIDKEESEIIFKYRNDLKSNLVIKDMILLLKENGQTVPRGINKILDLLSDLLTFGNILRCSKCRFGQLNYTIDGYKCFGNKRNCNFITKDPPRMEVLIPEELRLRHTFLYNYVYVPRKRFFPNSSVKIEKRKGPLPLHYKNIVFGEFTTETDRTALYSKVKTLGGRVVSEVRRSVFAIIATKEEVDKKTQIIRTSEEMRVYVVTFQFLDALLMERTITDLDMLANKYSLVPWGLELHNRVPDQFLNGRGPLKLRSNWEGEENGKRRMRVKDGIAIEPDSGLEDVAHVYQEGAVIFNAVLAATDYSKNKNKYYKLQILESDNSPNKYWLYSGWGRTGTTIGASKADPIATVYEAKDKFKEQFKRLTCNSWENRFCCTKKRSQYNYIDVSYTARKEEIQDLYVHIADSNLSPAVANLIAKIFNVETMKQMMLEYELDLEKMPLGKLSRSQIKKAYNILTNAAFTVHQKGRKNEIIALTNEFYSHMPHSSNLDRPPLLDNKEIIKRKGEMLANLMELETAYTIIQRGAEKDGGNPLDAYYKQLDTDIEVVPENSDEYKLIEEYVMNTHASTHWQYELKILDVFKVKRQEEDERYKSFKEFHNRRLLWHGSRTTNYAGILSQGLRIAPPEAPSTGFMFGKGIYFADMVSKSANYCCTSETDPEGLMLLCEVALGTMTDRTRSDSQIGKLQNGVHSVRALGGTEPNPNDIKTLPNGVQVPLGKPVTNVDLKTELLYNEYIVYNVNQVNIKYLLRLDFKYKN